MEEVKVVKKICVYAQDGKMRMKCKVKQSQNYIQNIAALLVISNALFHLHSTEMFLRQFH